MKHSTYDAARDGFGLISKDGRLLIADDGCFVLGYPWDNPMHIPMSLIDQGMGVCVFYMTWFYLPMRLPILIRLCRALDQDLSSGRYARRPKYAWTLTLLFWGLPVLSEVWYLILMGQSIHRAVDRHLLRQTNQPNTLE